MRTIFPNKIKIGNNKGIVIRAPKTDPLFRLRELPSAKRLIKIYEEMSKDGKAMPVEAKEPEILIAKKVPNSDIGTPINSQ